MAENKLNEPFLWIPDLEGPVFSKSTAEAMDWFKSIFTGNPILGWHDTLCYLSLPALLYVGQTISQKVLAPPKDPSKVKTDQELFSEGLINNLPLIVAFFSINVPAGLGLYWVVNNILTTIVTLLVKSGFKDESFPPEVTQMMALIDGPAGGNGGKAKSGMASSQAEFGRRKASMVDDRPKVSGFGAGQSPFSSAANGSSNAVIDAEVVSSSSDYVDGVVGGEDDDNDDSNDDVAGDNNNNGDESGSKRKKRTKAAKSDKRGKKK